MPITVINTGENIMDVAIREYGHIQGIYSLIKANGLSYSAEAAPGYELDLPVHDFSQLPKLNLLNISRKQDVKITVQPNQNIFDLAIQQYGSISGLFFIVKSNALKPTEFLKAGAELITNEQAINKPVVDFFKAKQKPAHGSNLVVDSEPVLTGIGYMAIEIDFIVS